MSNINLQNIDRSIASKLNPFIGYSCASGTHEQVQMGLSFLSIAVASLSDGSSDESMSGFSMILDAMSRAMVYEQEQAKPAATQQKMTIIGLEKA